MKFSLPSFLTNLLKSIINNIKQKNLIVHIQLTQKKLHLYLLKQSRKDISIKKHQQIALDNFEYEGCNIFNPTKVQRHIAAFLQENSLYKPRTTVSLANEENHAPLKQKLFTLQTALCIAKTPVKIIGMTTSAVPFESNKIKRKAFYTQINQNNLLDHFKGHNQNAAYPWIFSSSLAVIILVVSLIDFQGKSQKTITQNQSSIQELNSQNNKLKTHIQKLRALEEKYLVQQKEKDALKRTLRHINNPEQLLVDVSQAIPDNTWLTQISIEHKQRKAEKSPDAPPVKDKPLIIEGVSLDLEEIPTLIGRLSQSKQVKNLKLAQIKKIKPDQKKNKNKHYQFKITGQTR